MGFGIQAGLCNCSLAAKLGILVWRALADQWKCACTGLFQWRILLVRARQGIQLYRSRKRQE